mmetsp:Transcript_36347/g.90477  ORF Transcript_36347/g.90477 Transcript_36347/m.90477 type:complete len:244 (-) Transcript_36347:722-1453(-)
MTGPVHRPALVPREAVTEEIDHINVRLALRDALFQDFEPLVDQGQQAAVHYLLLCNLPTDEVVLAAVPFNQRLHRGVVARLLARAVVIPASLALLPQPFHLHQTVRNAACIPLRRPWVVPPRHVPNVVPRQVTHLQRAHRHAEAAHCRVHLGGSAPFLKHEERLRHVPFQHPVANEAVAVAREHGFLLEALAQLHDRRDRVARRLLALDVLEEWHHVRGAEEVHPRHQLRPAGGRRDLVDVEI